jgi:predicted amidohydrolase
MRRTRIATTSFLIEDHPHTIAMNLRRAAEYVGEAKQLGADVLLLPEMCPTLHVPEDETYTADAYPGAWTRHFSRLARAAKMNLLAPYYARIRGKIYNQTTVFDRRGRVVGAYRKVQPTAAEAKVVTAGSQLPVFTLDIGRVAVMTCMEIHFPEIPRIFALKGAEIIFFPTVSHGPTQIGMESQVRSRAMDNSLVIVEANCSGHAPYAPYAGRWRPGTARIVDHSGDIVAQTGRRAGIAMAEIDLDEVRLTSQVVLMREPDSTREDFERIFRADLFAREYAKLARGKRSYYTTRGHAGEDPAKRK